MSKLREIKQYYSGTSIIEILCYYSNKNRMIGDFKSFYRNEKLHTHCYIDNNLIDGEYLNYHKKM